MIKFIHVIVAFFFLSSKFGSTRIFKIHTPSFYYKSDNIDILRHSFVSLSVLPSVNVFKYESSISKNYSCYIQPVARLESINLNYLPSDVAEYFNSLCVDGIVIKIQKLSSPYVCIRTNDNYCPHVKRHHRHNHIYFLINLQSSFVFIRCYDSDCPKIESINYQLPLLIVNSLKCYVMSFC